MRIKIPDNTSKIIFLNSEGKQIDYAIIASPISLNSAFRMDTENEFNQSEREEIRDGIIQDLEISKLLPSVEQARKMILNAETGKAPEQDAESKTLGLPSIAEI